MLRIIFKAWFQFLEFSYQWLRAIDHEVEVISRFKRSNADLLKSNKAEYLKRLAEIEQRLKGKP